MKDNIILKTDSYKVSHFKQYPEDTKHVYSYLESRGGEFEKTVFFGLQYLLKKYLVGQVVTQEKIDEAEKFINAHMGPGTFNKDGWQSLLANHKGVLPLHIKAVPEGSIVQTKNVLMTVENTDPEFFWLTNYLETLLLHVWYPTTVATQSYYFKKLITRYLEKTGDPADIDFKLHDFGYRGVSSDESSMMGGAAHLLNFLGSDTLGGIVMLMEYYGAADMPAFSIPASEHSTITSWGKNNELEAMENMLDKYPTGLVACVSDSFDIYRACEEYWGTELKEKILNRDGTLVIRSDSGEPAQVVLKCLEILGNKFGFKVNEKGYKVLPPQIRLIQSDGIDLNMVEEILDKMMMAKWSVDNITFGCGGALLQKLNRDTCKFAFKCSSIFVGQENRDVYKQPVEEPFKVSKKGRLGLIVDKVTGEYKTVQEHEANNDQLVDVFVNGKLLNEYTLNQIKELCKSDIKN
jgi:nicotinamide phosphoribosyltransferase